MGAKSVLWARLSPTGYMASGSRRSKHCAISSWASGRCTKSRPACARFIAARRWVRKCCGPLARGRSRSIRTGISCAGAGTCGCSRRAGVGAFQLVDDRPGVREWFRNGEHLVIYRDRDHLRELVRYYLAHDDERRQIADAGRAHALAHHTYDHRMARLIEWVQDVRKE